MENNKDILDTPQYDRDNRASHTSLRPQKAYTPLAVMSICFAFFIVGQIISSGISFGLAVAMGLDFRVVLSTFNENSPIGMRHLMRATLFLNHVFSFILPAIATAIFVYKKLWINYLRLDKQPMIQSILMGIVWFVVSIPFVQWVFQMNQKLPLPQWMMNLENDTSHLLEGVIAQNNFYEIVINVLLIAVIPAIGEEMVFRGIIQQQIGKLLKNEHVVVWVSAAIFSAIHMQFQGFFARMLLGALLGYLFVWTKNLWVPMILHLLNNGLQVIGIYAIGIKPSEMDKLGDADKMPWWLGVLSLVATLCWAVLIQKAHQKPSDAPILVDNTEGSEKDDF
jgi:uncharacterized protein